jgi:hypothetical protein
MGRSHIEACVCGVRAGQCHRNPLSSTNVAARWCSNGVEKPPALAGGFPLPGVFRLSTRNSRVGDSGFEPLTSSASKKYDTLLEISAACKTPANDGFLSRTVCFGFQEIHSGCCTVAAQM